MTNPAKPTNNEKARVARLRRLRVLDSAPEKLFDEITKLASDLCGTPIALITLVDERRQWFKANTGLEGATETHSDVAFCAHTILEDKILEVEDATKDRRFKNNPLVTSDPNISFYAGMPLMLPGGYNVGTLCVADTKPKKLSDVQKRTLSGLSVIVTEALLLREHDIYELERKNNKLAAIVESSDDAIISKRLDGTVMSWNAAAEKMFGYMSDEMTGKSITKLFPLDKTHEEPELIEKLKHNQKIKHYETERITKENRRIQVSVSLSPIKNANGEIVGASKIIREITEVKALRKTIELEHERLKVTMDSIGDAVITTDRQGRIQYLNPIAEKLTGWSLSEAFGLPSSEVFNIVDETSREVATNPITQCLSQDRIVNLESNTALLSRDGKEYGIEDSAAPIRDNTGHTIGVVLVFHDVSAQRLMANEITYRATHDSLTGLINRSEFESLLEQSINEKKQPDTASALLFIDLDQFKIVNDTCGHAAGDILLKEISSNIKSCIRVSDIFARIGGDEFAIVLQECSPDVALDIANGICNSVSEYRFAFNNQRFRISASIGLVIIDSYWSTATKLLQAADFACYKAKHAGRNRVHLHHNEDGALERNRDEAQWANRLEAALEENRFELFAQRIMPLRYGELEHVEILLRLRSETGELITPGSFMTSAERFHMMGRIDRWVVKEALSWVGNNISQLAHIESISINLSGQSLNDKTFHHYVTTLIDQLAFDPAKICFEITETVAISNIAEVISFLESLKHYGVQFSLDDFGSGVSSFGYLKTLPVDYLKIDGQFIKDLAENRIGQATVRCIAEIAQITHKKTIAEWVESEQVENILKKMGVDFTQGFHQHEPAPIGCLLE